MLKQKFFLFVLTFSLPLLSITAAAGQDIQLDACISLAEFPTFERQQDVSEVEQIYQQINIERLTSGRSAYGYNESLSNTATAIAGSLVATAADESIPTTSVGDESAQQILESNGYERWPDDNGFIVEATRSVHDIGNQSVDDIVDTLFEKAGNRGLVQENARSMLESSSYREIGIAVTNRPATREKVVVIIVGARPNEFPVVINFGGRTVTEYASVLSFHNEENRPEGSSSPSILGRLLTLELRNPMNQESSFNVVNWQPYCAWYPSNFAPGVPIDVEVQFTDLKGQQVLTSVSEWMPDGELPIAAPPPPSPDEDEDVSVIQPPDEDDVDIVPTTFELEAEIACTGSNDIMARSKASDERTVFVNTSQTLSCVFVAETEGAFSIEVRYSNDQGGGGAELLSLSLNDELLSPVLQAVNTRRSDQQPGEGWNNFYVAPFSDDPTDQVIISLTQGESYTLEIAISAGDGYGVEIDRIRFTPR